MSVIIKVCVYYKSRYATWLSKHLKASYMYVATYRIVGFCHKDFYLAIGSIRDIKMCDHLSVTFYNSLGIDLISL